MDSEIDLDGQHPFVKLGGGPIEERGFWYEDNFAGIWNWGCRRSWRWSGHDGVVESSIVGGVAERIVINNNSELSGDPLLV